METNTRADDSTQPTESRASEVDKLTAAVWTDEWLANTSLQAQSIAWFREYRGTVSRQDQKIIFELLRQRLEVSEDRLKKLLKLTQFYEITRALQAGKNGETTRSKEDNIYPSDGIIGAHLAYAGGNESPLAWHFWTIVAVIGAACRRNFFYDGGNYLIYPNHYVLLLGPSGSKKGTCLNPGYGILSRLNDRLGELKVIEEDRIALAPKKLAPETFLHILQAKEILENLGDTPRFADSVAFFGVTELAVLLGKSVFHSDHFVHVLTDLYDCPDEYEVFTLKRGKELLKNVAVSLVGCTTQEWLENATSSDVFTGGFMGRCIVVPRGYTDKCYPTADYLDPIAKDEIAEALVPLATSNSFQLIIKDQAWYDEWYRENKRVMKNQTDKRLDGYFSRRPTHLVRLASVLSLSKRNRYITKEAMILADKILVHEEKYLVETVGGMGKHQRAKEADLIFAIIKQHGTPISRSKLSNKSFGITGGKRGLDRILESLLDRKVIDLAREGRSLVYFVIGES